MSIVLDHVSKGYQDHSVLNQFSFSFPDEGRYALFGPSGCGKTTLLRIIGGLEVPDSGKVIRDPSRRIAWMFQENRLLPWFTVEKNLNFVTGNPALSREWLERINLPKIGSLYPEQLSGGMKRRVSLARTLAMDAEILLMDEPFKELDTASADTMLQLVDEYTRDRLLILVTHQLSDTEKLQCRMISMSLIAMNS